MRLSLHRARDRLAGERTALINQLRAFLLERGLIMPQGRRKLESYPETLLAAGPARAGARSRGAPLSRASHCSDTAAAECGSPSYLAVMRGYRKVEDPVITGGKRLFDRRLPALRQP